MNKGDLILAKLGEINTELTEEFYNIINRRAKIRKTLINICTVTSCLLTVAAVSTAAAFAIIGNQEPAPVPPVEDTVLFEENDSLPAEEDTVETDETTDTEAAESETENTETADTETETVKTESTEAVTADTAPATEGFTESETVEVTEVVEVDLFGGEGKEDVASSTSGEESKRYVVSIIKRPQSVTLPSFEKFYTDENNFYYFPNSGDSRYVIVEYSDGTTQNVKAALYEGNISITDLDTYGIKYHTEKRVDRGPIKTIIDHSLTDGEEYMSGEFGFYKDYYYSYYFKQYKYHRIIVYFENGDEVKMKMALDEGSIDIEDLDRFGIEYYKKSN